LGLAIFVLHRAVTGTTERFMGLLIEQYGGAFQPWLTPAGAGAVSVRKRGEGDLGVMSVDDLIVRLKTEL
jgi:threonyl-tRNA synthetase